MPGLKSDMSTWVHGGRLTHESGRISNDEPQTMLHVMLRDVTRCITYSMLRKLSKDRSSRYSWSLSPGTRLPKILPAKGGAGAAAQHNVSSHINAVSDAYALHYIFLVSKSRFIHTRSGVLVTRQLG